MKERFQTFTVLISKISRNIKKIKNQEMAEYGLRSVHVTCLYYLYAQESLTATELCELCEEDKATISRGLDFLEENGYIVCETKQAKRYKSALVLTEKGMEIADKIYTRHKKLTDFFIALGVDPDVAEDDACKIEHDISDETFDAICTHIDKFGKTNKTKKK